MIWKVHIKDCTASDTEYGNLYIKLTRSDNVKREIFTEILRIFSTKSCGFLDRIMRIFGQQRIVSVILLRILMAEEGYGGSAGGRRRALRGGSGGGAVLEALDSSNTSHSSSMVE